MASGSLKEKTVSALFWNFIDKGGQQFIQLLFVYILARLLSPSQFGTIGVLAIFTVVANILQESGFSSALIRKKDVDDSDYSTVFYFNIFVSLFLYGTLFFSAPWIAAFYELPEITGLSRVLFLTFIFNAFGIVQNVHLIRRMDFKANARITLFAGCIAGIVAVVLAYNGFGAWSLVLQIVLQSVVRNILLWVYIRWFPKEKFVWERLKNMWSYSVYLLLASLFNQIAANLYTNVIGKSFSLTDAGYYGQANKLTYIPQNIVSSSIQGVTYPVLTKVDDKERRKRIFRKIVRITAFISFPIACLTIILAHSAVEIILSDTWLQVVPMVQILSIGVAFFPLYCLLNALLQAEGKSALLFRIELARNIAAIVSIFITYRLGILGMISGLSTVSILAFLVGYYFAGKSISYTLTELLKDIFPYLVLAGISILPFFLLNRWIPNVYLLFFTQAILGVLIYIGIVKISGSRILEECIEFVRNKGINK